MPDVAARNKMTFTHVCNSKFVPDVSDGIRWVDSNGERLCHLYWARQVLSAGVGRGITVEFLGLPWKKEPLDCLDWRFPTVAFLYVCWECMRSHP